MDRPTTRIVWIPPILTLIISGCDDGAARVAREAADRQAQQNTAMSTLTQEVASGSRELVAADARARHEIIGVHRDLQAERSRLDTGWSALAEERQEIVAERRTESLLAPAIEALGSALLAALLLGYCWYLLVAGRQSEVSDAELNAVLVGELLDQVRLPAHDPTPLLPIPDKPATP
jgi:hypothetical protein